jgi:hypothetical protein
MAPARGHIVASVAAIFETYQTNLRTNLVRNTKECWSWLLLFRENTTSSAARFCTQQKRALPAKRAPLSRRPIVRYMSILNCVGIMDAGR